MIPLEDRNGKRRRRKKPNYFPIILCLILVAVIVFFATGKKHASIQEWSGKLSQEKVEWAVVSNGYGIEKISYMIPQEEYEELVDLLKTIREKQCSRNLEDAGMRNDCNLAVYTDGKLWLFHCRDNGLVSLTFADEETSAYFGCENTPLYIDNPQLWDYIMTTVEAKAQ